MTGHVRPMNSVWTDSAQAMRVGKLRSIDMGGASRPSELAVGSMAADSPAFVRTEISDSRA